MLDKISEVLQINKIYLVIGFMIWSITFIHFTFNRHIKGINRFSYITFFILIPPIAPLFYIIKTLILRVYRKRNHTEEEVTFVIPSKEETLKKAKLNAKKFNTKKT